MKYSVRFSVDFPDTTDKLEITLGQFTFLANPQHQGQIEHISVDTEADSRDIAHKIAETQLNDFLAVLTLHRNVKYRIGKVPSINFDPEDVEVQEVGSERITRTISISVTARIVRPMTDVLDWYRALSSTTYNLVPIRLYREAVLAHNSFEQYRKAYRVLECYRVKRSQQKYKEYADLRGRILHGSKKVREEEAGLLIEERDEDKKVILESLPYLMNEARNLIREREGI